MNKLILISIMALGFLALTFAGENPPFTKIEMHDLLATGVRDNQVTGSDTQGTIPEMRQTLTLLPGYKLEHYLERQYAANKGIQTSLVRYDYAIESNNQHAGSFILTESSPAGAPGFRFSFAPIDARSGYYSSSWFDPALKELVVKFGRYTVLE